MLLHRDRLPEEGELVLCTITNIHFNSVFARIEEFGKQGMIHISEVSPGRIRNIRDYVAEGKVVICKILKIDREKGHIDLSLRRVSEGQRRKKASALKQEQRAEKIIELLAHRTKKDKKLLYKEIAIPILVEYEYVFDAFESVSKDELSLDDLNIPKEYKKELLGIIKDKIRPKIVEITGTSTLQSYESDGVIQIQKVFSEVLEKFPNLSIKYIGGGKYNVRLTADDYKEAEKTLKDVQEKLDGRAKKEHMTYTFQRAE